MAHQGFTIDGSANVFLKDAPGSFTTTPASPEMMGGPNLHVQLLLPRTLPINHYCIAALDGAKRPSRCQRLGPRNHIRHEQPGTCVDLRAGVYDFVADRNRRTSKAQPRSCTMPNL
ncbi:hypothetical protein KM043_018388 [Ampulex compressa]|nr:hypothetical protein KM043_018388 [Ampulex compressa]